MERALRITFHGLDPSDAVERRIRAKAQELERVYDHITSCHVRVEAPQQHQHKGSVYGVHIDIHVPDKAIVVSRERALNKAHEDVYVAIRDAFLAATRQLEHYAQRKRGKPKQRETPPHGRVTRLYAYDGYGFAEMSDGLEVYFHENSVPEGAFAGLQVGDEVRVVLAPAGGDKGPQASTVTPIGKHHLLDEPSA